MYYLLALPADVFILHCYNLLLRRLPDDVGARHYKARIALGYDRRLVFRDLLSSAEWHEKYSPPTKKSINAGDWVSYIFLQLLSRPPQSNEMAHYVSRIESGLRLRSLYDVVITSHEFAEKNNLQPNTMREIIGVARRPPIFLKPRLRRTPSKSNALNEAIQSISLQLGELASDSLIRTARASRSEAPSAHEHSIHSSDARSAARLYCARAGIANSTHVAPFSANPPVIRNTKGIDPLPIMLHLDRLIVSHKAG